MLYLSENYKINDSVPIDFQKRLKITGSKGEYNLVIYDVKKLDEGEYACTFLDKKLQKQQLVVKGITLELV